MASMFPVLPTCFAAVRAGSAIPVAISRTLEPGFIPASSTKRLLTPSVAVSIVFHHFCQPGAALS